MGFSRSCRDEEEYGFARRNRETLFRPYVNCNCILGPVTLQIPEPQPSSSANNRKDKDSLTREVSFSAFRTPVSYSKVDVKSSDAREQNLVKGHLSETPLNLTLRNMSLKTDVMTYSDPHNRQPVNLFNHIRSTLFPYSASVSPDYKCSKLYCDIWPHHQWHTMYQGSHSWPLKQNGSESTALTRESPYLDKKSKCGLDYPVPLPKASDGEPLDLLPKSFFADKSKRGHLCIYCGKLYSRKYGLKIHLRTHTGYKPLKCKICLRPFGDPSNLNKHIRLHADGDTPYRCEYCGKVLVRRRDLERHIKSRHPNTESSQNGVEEVGRSIDVENDIIVVT
ncbi:hypothetical protein KUTeg_007211 [Tegillarca granosa]|uniref:C2H2-type domain-containing protein n=1 Tax=Tegillarca granosa TaxID=220873 RepID=A0ABQ9FEJ3_TEGGR|nr:hypothetical protein KUTeg_007211 [Tegillarca granosa]